MRKIPVFVAACLGLLASAAVPARADEAGKLADFAKRMFATRSFDQKTTACFVRTYDATHLARHRKQVVTAMKMQLAVEKLPEDGELSYSYKLRINFRDRPGEYASSYQCGEARMSDVKREGVRIYCHDGCEGGGVEIALAPDAKAIIVKLDDVGVWLADKPQDESAQFDFKSGPDDRVFRLDRVDAEQCKSLMNDSDEVAALPSE